MHPVRALRPLVAQLEDVGVLLPHPAMGEYRCVVVVVADDQVLGEATVKSPSGLGEGLFYLLWGDVPLPLSKTKRNALTLGEKTHGP